MQKRNEREYRVMVKGSYRFRKRTRRTREKSKRRGRRRWIT